MMSSGIVRTTSSDRVHVLTTGGRRDLGLNRVTGTAIGCGAALALLLSGCGGGDGASADPPSSSSSTGSPSSSGSTDSSPSPSASTPTVAPARGVLLEQASATMNAPTGFVHAPDLVHFQDSAFSTGSSNDVVSMSQSPWGGGSVSDAARLALKSSSYILPPKRLEDVLLDGVPAYHLAGGPDRYTAGDMYGALYQGDLVTVEFDFSKQRSPAERRKMMASSLATFHWK